MASLRKLPLLAATLLVPLLAQSASKTSNMQVSVTIVGECAVITTPLLNFGTTISATFNSPVNATSGLQVNCALNTPYSITLDGGMNSAGSIINRQMKSGTALLAYGLYTNATHTTAWGDGTSGQKVSGVGNGMPQTLTVYGQLPVPTAGTTPAPGAYVDTVTATLTY